MNYAPFTLRIMLDKNGQAREELHLDDGVSYNYPQEFVAEQPSKKEKNEAVVKPTAICEPRLRWDSLSRGTILVMRMRRTLARVDGGTNGIGGVCTYYLYHTVEKKSCFA